MKNIKIISLFLCIVMLFAVISPVTRIEKTDLIAQIVIWGYGEGFEDYLLQVTDRGALFAFRGEEDYPSNKSCYDYAERFAEVFEMKSRILTRDEYRKVIELIKEIKSAKMLESGGIVEQSPELVVYIDDDVYGCPYWFAWPEDAKLQRLAYNLVLMSPIQSGSKNFEHLIKEADEVLNGYTDESGKIIEPRL